MAAVENAHLECRWVVTIPHTLLVTHVYIASEKALLADLKDGLALIIT